MSFLQFLGFMAALPIAIVIATKVQQWRWHRSGPDLAEFPKHDFYPRPPSNGN